MGTNIVTVIGNQIVGSTPSTFQQTGAMVSQGGTTTAVNTTSLITQLSDLTTILQDPTTLVSVVWDSGVVTVVTTDPTTIPIDTTVQGVITGCVPTAYNGTYNCTYVSATSFTYPLTNDPTAISTLGTFQLGSAVDLLAYGTTFFAQGNNISYYVLELGCNSTVNGVTSLTSYMGDPTIPFYDYLLPSSWDAEANAYALASTNSAFTSKVYFYVPTTLSTYSNWESFKSVVTCIENTSAPVTEEDIASIFWTSLSYNPNSTSPMAPMQYRYVSGVTANVLTVPVQSSLKSAGVNWISTGAEGGVSNTLIKWGTYMDLNQFTYWYAIDWVQINAAQTLAYTVIQGSNLTANPLIYNQSGINRLQTAINALMKNAVTFGVVLSPFSCTAVSFENYITQNPNDYSTGTYSGLSLTFTPAVGFESITIYLTASNIPLV